MSDNTSVKTVVYYLTKNNTDQPSELAFSVNTVNIRVSELVNSGYRLMNTHFLGETKSPNAYGVMYILVKDPIRSSKG
jgi:hypothetical protein